MILITVLGIIVILSGLVLAFAISMRSEGMASANRLSYVQADAVEQGAEMWVLAQVDSYPSDALTITQTPAEAIQVGNGYFWILHPDPNQYQTFAYGITDEAGKININSAVASTSAIGPQLANLPNLDDETDVVDNIVAWSQGGTADPTGANSQYYESLQEPYNDRYDFFTQNAGIPGTSKFESVEELLLVENLTPQMLYGQDLNRNGVLDAAEQTSNGNTTIQGGGDDPRGFFNYVTCYSKYPGAAVGNNFTPAPATTISINGLMGATINNGNLQNQLVQLGVSTADAASIQDSLGGFLGRNGNSRNWTMGNFISNSGPAMTGANLGLIFDALTVTGASRQIPMLNVNTASGQAMSCLPGLSAADGQNLADAQAGGAATGNLSWFFNSLQQAQIAAVAPYITDRSYQYSADIVAVSGDGRSFKRVRIVIDASGAAAPAAGATPPSPAPVAQAQIIYRKDLTSLGWPLDPAIRKAMRQGRPPPDVGSQANGQGTMLPQ